MIVADNGLHGIFESARKQLYMIMKIDGDKITTNRERSLSATDIPSPLVAKCVKGCNYLQDPPEFTKCVCESESLDFHRLKDYTFE